MSCTGTLLSRGDPDQRFDIIQGLLEDRFGQVNRNRDLLSWFPTMFLVSWFPMRPSRTLLSVSIWHVDPQLWPTRVLLDIPNCVLTIHVGYTTWVLLTMWDLVCFDVSVFFLARGGV